VPQIEHGTDHPPGGFPVVGVVGGGRLARMTQPAAIALGVRLRVLVESPRAGAAQVVPDAPVGGPWDEAAVAAFAQACDVLTVVRDDVPLALLEKLEADGVVVRPGPAALAHAEDGAGLGPGRPERIRSRRELAALVARSPSGQASAWPVVETIRLGGNCHEVIAPAPGLDPEAAARVTDLALRLAGELGVVGVLAVGMLEADGGPGGTPRVVVDELAMRPHHCGHWTVDGAVTGQFEQHLRAVLDLPLGDPRARAPWSVTVEVPGGDYPDLFRSYLHVMARDPGVKVHMYGKDVRPGSVVGHVTVCGSDLDDVRARARHAADFIAGVINE
jgi:phosphoribosylaminoimidazole carboxylase (NCAIR synthetase)